MITYFVRQFLEGGDDRAGRGAAAPCGLATATCHTRPARGNPQPRAGSNAVLRIGTAECACALPVSPHRGLPHLRRGSRTTLRCRNVRYSCGTDRCVLRNPFVHLTTGWAMHRNGHAREAFEQNPLGLKTGCNECARARALNEYVGQRRTPSGDAINVYGSVAAPPLCARDKMVRRERGRCDIAYCAKSADRFDFRARRESSKF
jgi:hypothetical protein